MKTQLFDGSHQQQTLHRVLGGHRTIRTKDVSCVYLSHQGRDGSGTNLIRQRAAEASSAWTRTPSCLFEVRSRLHIPLPRASVTGALASWETNAERGAKGTPTRSIGTPRQPPTGSAETLGFKGHQIHLQNPASFHILL